MSRSIPLLPSTHWHTPAQAQGSSPPEPLAIGGTGYPTGGELARARPGGESPGKNGMSAVDVTLTSLQIYWRRLIW